MKTALALTRLGGSGGDGFLGIRLHRNAWEIDMFPVISGHTLGHTAEKAHETTGLNPWTDLCFRVDCASECTHPRRCAADG